MPPLAGLLFQTKEAMPYERAQCLIFFVTPKDKELNPHNKPEKIYAFLPDSFINNHPDVLLVFQNNNILVVRNDDKPQILAGKNKSDLEVLEVFLDNSPTASVDPLLVVCDEDDACFLFHLFSKNPINLSRKRDDDANVTEVKNSQGLPSFLGKGLTLRFPVYRTFKTNQSIYRAATSMGHPGLAKLASEYRIGINHRYDDGYTTLHYAAAVCDPVTVQNLIEAGAAVDAKIEGIHVDDMNGCTPLHIAKTCEVARILLENGADIHTKASDGSTPLHWAVSKEGTSALILFLIEKGADVNARDKEGRTPLHEAGYPENAEMLLQNGADVNALDNEKMTPIILEISADGSFDLVLVLLKYGASVDVKWNGDSILEEALKQNQLKVFKYLLERCFLNPSLLMDSITQATTDGYLRRCFKIVLSRHVLKIQILNLQRHNFTNFDAPRFQMYRFSAKVRDKCEVEVARMRSQTLCGTAVSVYNILEKNDSQLACLLRNDSFAQIAESEKWVEQFPIYGSILTCHFENGKLRKSLQEEGMKIFCQLFSFTSRPLPNEIKDEILSYLNNDDIVNLKLAVPLPVSSVNRRSNVVS